jgi:hypothetical protein
VWDSNKKDLYSWEEAQGKFNLTPTDARDWGGIINKLAEDWRGKLEEDSDSTYAGMWLGLYEEGKEDPVFVVRCVSEFTPSCFQPYNITLFIPAKCFTVGTYSRCLREWEHPDGDVEGYFHEVKIIHTNRGPKKKEGEEKEEVIFFYGKVTTLPWDPDRWRWGDGGRFLDYTTKKGREILTSGNQGSTRAAEK